MKLDGNLARLLATAVLLGLLPVRAASGDSEEQPEPYPPVEFGAPKARVLLLGTFHFQDPGLDSFKPERDIDVLSPRRQQEIQELTAALAKFGPTRIAVERMPELQGELDRAYREFRAGVQELGADEVEQIGFRLAHELGHERLFAVDAKRRFYEPWVDPDEYAAEHQQTEVTQDPWPAVYERLYRATDRLKLSRSLREHLLALNAREAALRGHGRYLVESFKAGLGPDYPGVDSRTAWFNRNLRIFANLTRITRGPEERILLLIGSGHLAILRHCVEASPEYELVELAELLE